MRRLTVAAVAATILLAATGCLTPLRSQQPLTPVPVPASPVVGVYEPGVPGSWSKITEFTLATDVKPRIVVYYSPWNDPFAASFAQHAGIYHQDWRLEDDPDALAAFTAAVATYLGR